MFKLGGQRPSSKKVGGSAEPPKHGFLRPCFTHTFQWYLSPVGARLKCFETRFWKAYYRFQNLHHFKCAASWEQRILCSKSLWNACTRGQMWDVPCSAHWRWESGGVPQWDRDNHGANLCHFVLHVKYVSWKANTYCVPHIHRGIRVGCRRWYKCAAEGSCIFTVPEQRVMESEVKFNDGATPNA